MRLPTRTPSDSISRRAVQAALVALLVPALPSRAATIQSVVQALDDNEAHNIAIGDIIVNIGRPNSDSWCSVEVFAPQGVEYLWLKDAQSPLARKIYAAKSLRPSESAVLQKQLKVGYRAKPLYYSREIGLYEGEAFTVK